MKKFIAAYWIAISIGCALVAGPAAAATDTDKEYKVKAAFIYKFVKFSVEWPSDAAVDKQSNIDICILGNSPLAERQEVFKAASTPKLNFSLKNEQSAVKAAEHCHVVFVGSSEEHHLEDILGALKGKPILTISDLPDFVEQGGMIGFVMNNNNVRFEVNKGPVTTAGMRVDAQLLELALKVIDK